MNKLNKVREIKSLLLSGKPTIGSWMQIPNTSVAEIIGQAGYDWIAIDLEHGSMSTSQLPDLFRALELGGTLPLVRLAQGHSKDIKQALDSGAGGIIIPMIESAAQLSDVIKYSCWPPAGERGVGFSRANLYGKYFDAYVEEAQAPLIIAQIEHIKAVENINTILRIKGLDGIIIGPYDLSASMGLTGQFKHAKFLNALNDIQRACKKHNKAAGVHIVNPEIHELQQRIEEGYQFIAYSIDSVFLNKIVQKPTL